MVEIKIGDLVRSFDFEGRDVTGERACYCEGVVVGIGRFGFPDCDRYKVAVERVVWCGADEALDPNADDGHRYPPVNGTPTMFRGTVTDGVELITNGG